MAGVLQPLIWLVLFGALFANAPEGLLPDGMSYGRFLGAGVIVFTAFSAALNAGLPVSKAILYCFYNIPFIISQILPVSILHLSRK